MRQENRTDLQYQPESYRLYHACLIVAAAVLRSYIVLSDHFMMENRIQNTCLILCFLMAALHGIVILTDSVYWLSGITYESAKNVGRHARHRCASVRFVLYTSAFVLYCLYCRCPGLIPWTGGIADSAVAGTVLCAAALLADCAGMEQKTKL